MKDPKFTVGQKVIAMFIDPYRNHLTEGKEYTVTDYQAEVYTPTFTWSAYVTVIGDWGKPVTCHTYRFKAVE